LFPGGRCPGGGKCVGHKCPVTRLQPAVFARIPGERLLDASLLATAGARRLRLTSVASVLRVVTPLCQSGKSSQGSFTSYDLNRTDLNKLSPQGRRDDMPPRAGGSSTRGGSTSVRGRVRSLHVSGCRPAAGSQRADSLGWERQTDGSRYRLSPPSLRRRHNKST